MPDRHAAGLGEGRLEVTERSGGRSRAVQQPRAVQQLRAWVVCLSFAVCLPAAGRWELAWPARTVATLVSVAVGVAALPRTATAALASAAPAPARSSAPPAPWASTGVLAEPPSEQRDRAPGFDGRQLYLEQCTLTC